MMMNTKLKLAIPAVGVFAAGKKSRKIGEP